MQTQRTRPGRAVPGFSFSNLSASEQNLLREWQQAAVVAGIDAVEDLQQRAWPCPIAENIIGIFKHSDDRASWLVVGQAGAWAVACCDSGDISHSFGSLAEALSQVYAMQPTFDRLGDRA